jgi:hypothetical protein
LCRPELQQTGADSCRASCLQQHNKGVQALRTGRALARRMKIVAGRKRIILIVTTVTGKATVSTRLYQGRKRFFFLESRLYESSIESLLYARALNQLISLPFLNKKITSAEFRALQK